MVHTTYDASSTQSKRLRKAAGRYLAGLRKDAQLTQRVLADLVGLDYYTFISQLECGAGRVPPNLYAAFADALGINRQEFGRQMVKFYDPWTYEILFGESPYKMQFEGEEEAGKKQQEGC